VSPSGRLPVTFPAHETDVIRPSWSDAIEYTEGLHVGWKALHDQPVDFPFGHGLSYSSFSYQWAAPPPAHALPAVAMPVVAPSELSRVRPLAHEREECWWPCGRTTECRNGFCGAAGVCCRVGRDLSDPSCRGTIGCDDKHCCVANVTAQSPPSTPAHQPPALAGRTDRPALTLRITVTNTGAVAAAEVAQLYLAFPAGYGEPPLLLRGFFKTAVLQPGHSEELRFELRDSDLAVWDVGAEEWRRATGTFEAKIGRSSRDEHSLRCNFEA